MRLNLFASVALLCSSVLAAPTQLRRQDGELGSVVGELGGEINSLIAGLGGQYFTDLCMKLNLHRATVGPGGLLKA
jgi:hypothetical protein